MTLALIVQILLAALKFPEAFSAFLKLIQSTPEEQHAALVAQIQAQADTLAQTGRPG